MAAASVDEETDLVTCSICLEIYTDPRALPCLHSFCSHCLEGLANKKRHGKITCPLCQEGHNMAGKGISKFREDFRTKALVEKHQRVKRQKVEKDAVQSDIEKFSAMLQDHINVVKEAQGNLNQCKEKVQSEIKLELENIKQKILTFESGIISKIDAQDRCFKAELEGFAKMEAILSSMNGKSSAVAINNNKLKECLADLGKTITEWKLKYAFPYMQIQEFNIKDVFGVNFRSSENPDDKKPDNKTAQSNDQETTLAATPGPSTSGQDAIQLPSSDTQSQERELATLKASWTLEDMRLPHRICVRAKTGHLLAADDDDIIAYNMQNGSKLFSIARSRERSPDGIGMIQMGNFEHLVENFQGELKFRSLPGEDCSCSRFHTWNIKTCSFSSLSCTDDTIALSYFEDGSVQAICLSVKTLKVKCELDSQLQRTRSLCLLESQDKFLLAFTGWHSHSPGFEVAIRVLDEDDGLAWDLDWQDLDRDTASNGRFDLRSIVTNGDSFFVANFYGGTVYAVSSDGQLVQKIITKLQCPQALAYCPISNRLCVDTQSDNTVNIYQINM